MHLHPTVCSLLELSERKLPSKHVTDEAQRHWSDQGLETQCMRLPQTAGRGRFLSETLVLILVFLQHTLLIILLNPAEVKLVRILDTAVAVYTEGLLSCLSSVVLRLIWSDRGFLGILGVVRNELDTVPAFGGNREHGCLRFRGNLV